MVVPKFAISTYVESCIVGEDFGPDGMPLSRYLNGLINCMLLSGLIWFASREYLTLRKALKEGGRGKKRHEGEQTALSTLTSLFIAFTVNNLLRGSHMVDHVLRPVYYHEPQWAYEKLYFTECDKPTISHFPITLLALLGITRLMKVIASGSRKGMTLAMIFMTLYILSAFYGLIHYTVEPPSNYGPFPNMNIGGTIITNFPVIFFMLKIYFGTNTSKGDGKEQLLKESVPTGNKSVGRVRSRTPVKN